MSKLCLAVCYISGIGAPFLKNCMSVQEDSNESADRPAAKQEFCDWHKTHVLLYSANSTVAEENAFDK
jgi:hypothetical protein